MKIPKKIHYAGFDYKVKMVKNLDGESTLGRTHRDKLEIWIESDVPQSVVEEVFIHELMHIAYGHTFSDQKGGDEEEKRINAFSLNIYGILKDNDLLK